MSKLLPNFTPIPQIIIREWMKNLNGSEFKVLMIIADQTYGWIEDKETGRRKKTDWISYSQLCEKAGLTATPISSALRKLEELNYIEVNNDRGEILTTHEQRNGKKLYYSIIAQTTLKSREVVVNLSKNSTRESRETKETYTKENIYIPVFQKWNEKNIIRHSVLTEKMERAINGRLREKHTIEEILTAIDNYAAILAGDQYYFKHKWTLQDFLQRGFDKFLDLKTAQNNYMAKKINGLREKPKGLFGELADLMEREGVKSI